MLGSSAPVGRRRTRTGRRRVVPQRKRPKGDDDGGDGPMIGPKQSAVVGYIVVECIYRLGQAYHGSFFRKEQLLFPLEKVVPNPKSRHFGSLNYMTSAFFSMFGKATYVLPPYLSLIFFQILSYLL